MSEPTRPNPDALLAAIHREEAARQRGRQGHALATLGFILRIFAGYTVLGLACFLMLRTIIGYTTFQTNVQFLAQKQDYIGNPIWMFAFYTHVFSAVVALMAGFTQFSKQFLQDHRQWHRWFGRVYVVVVLLINVPAGLIMGIYANGGMIGKTAFLLLDVLWFLTTYLGYTKAKKRNFVAHKNWMIRSYALTLSAITLRTWKIILSHSFNIDMAPLYIIDAWLGFVPNLLMAEAIIRIQGNVTTRKY